MILGLGSGTLPCPHFQNELSSIVPASSPFAATSMGWASSPAAKPSGWALQRRHHLGLLYCAAPARCNSHFPEKCSWSWWRAEPVLSLLWCQGQFSLLLQVLRDGEGISQTPLSLRCRTGRCRQLSHSLTLRARLPVPLLIGSALLCWSGEEEVHIPWVLNW